MKLKKVLLNNWLYYHHEIVPFEDINLLTGKTGQGKSAFLDALNIVLYGEVKSWNFNKAANDKSNRSVLSYLKGKYKDKGFLRDKGIFNTYIVLEFEDDLGKPFCEGIVFEVDGQSDGRRDFFFTLNSAIPEHEFLKEDNMSYTIKDLRAFIKEGKDEKSKLFDRNEDYQADLRLKLGLKDTRQFIKISKKALSYATIDKIDNFIVENICDFDRKVDIEQLLNEMRDYRELAELLKNMKEKKFRLEGIRDLQTTYRDKQKLLSAYRREKVEKEYQQLILKKEEFTQMLETAKKKLEIKKDEIVRLSKEKDEADDKYINALSAYRSQATTDLDQRIREISAQKIQVEENKDAMTQKVKHGLQYLTDKFNCLEDVMDEELEEQNISLIDMSLLIQKAVNHLDNGVPCLTDDEQSTLFQSIKEIRNTFYAMQSTLKLEQTQAFDVVEKSKETMQNYRKGLKNYPAELLRLKKKIEEELCKKYNKEIPLYILADVMEVRDSAWANAIEGFLGKRKFNLLVEPAYFQDAYQLYKNDEELQQIYEYSIIDVDRIQPRKDIGVATLYDCVTCENPYADKYVQYMLAGVVLCEHDEDINAYPVSITKECMLYQSYGVRRIHEHKWRKHYIGGNAIVALLNDEEIRLQALERDFARINTRLQNLEKGQIENSEALHLTMEQYSQLCVTLLKVREDVKSLLKQKELVDNKEIEQLQKQMETSKAYKNHIEDKYRHAKNDLERLQERIHSLQEDFANNQQACEAFEENHQDDLCFEDLQEVSSSLSEIQSRLLYVQVEMDNLQKESIRLENDLLNAKKDYNREFQLSLNEHMDSDEFDREYVKYPGHEILANAERFKAKEQVARETFENSFLGSLKKRIDGTKSAIDDLNANISMIPFGHSKYRFKMEPKKEYEEIYHVIMSDELNGRSLWNTQTYEENQNILDDLFNQISEYSMSNDYYVKEQLKARVENLSDYTTYLEFDITDNGESLKKSITDKSGGETQTPFYIAILASLMNCYRDKHEEKLVLLDEAFDKMDSERIKECISLLRILKFQAIVVTTNDKIINLGAIVDSVKVAKTKEISSGKKASMVMNFFREHEQLYE